MDDDRETREEHHGQEAVAKDAHHTADRHATSAHQVENNVHTRAAHQTNAIDVTKVDFTMLQGVECVCVRA